MLLGLVVEGGGVRAMYAAGVLDVLSDLPIHFDGVIGVSAGAIHGCSFVSGQKGRSLRYYKRFISDDRFFSLKTLIKTGNIVDTQFCYHDIPEKLDIFDEAAFEASGTRFFAGCSNVETGKPEYLELKNMFEEIEGLRASASLPYLSKIVEFRGLKLLDGGCVDRIPVKAFQKMGFDRNVVVLTQPRTHKVKDRDAWLAPLFYRQYPQFCQAFKGSSQTYEETQRYIEAEEKAGRVFVIRPQASLNVGRLTRDPEAVQYAYDCGVKDAQAKLNDLLNWK